MKKHNPSIPIMLREAQGTSPKVYARYEFGQEKSQSLEGMNSRAAHHFRSQGPEPHIEARRTSARNTWLTTELQVCPTSKSRTPSRHWSGTSHSVRAAGWTSVS
ncbi:hypothetical protein N8I77_010203 [Diaporthe amygdali]|uniref:Ribosomal protein/NADH dehydrogenase domain-containing protein n=1 Tax=Phomopsis amygdali TaxID=1214568 RepID=A0AAD9W0R5_PHOAM|nr:hypothetical protein N8I77_010203 [Diaporthe amygdali]